MNVKKEIHDGQEILIIRILQHKTEQQVSIPVIQKAKNLIEPGFQEQTVLRLRSNTTINRHLKTIAKKLELNKRLTFHVSRHSFAVTAIIREIPIEVISKLLGHTELKTTQIYTKIVDELKIKYMKRMDDQPLGESTLKTV